MTVVEKLEALRSLMNEKNMAAYIVPADDFHGSEYVGDYFKAREYMSGFTGSAGTLVVLPDRACLWTDGRYFLQADAQLQGSTIELMKAGQPGVPEIADFLADSLKENDCIGFDGRTVTSHFVQELSKKTDVKKISFSGEEDLVGMIWKERPQMSMEPVWELDVKYAGMTREEKLASLRERMKEEKADVIILAALDEIAWLLNLRGNDVKCTPVFLAYMVIDQNRAVLCAHEEILSEDIRKKLSDAGIEVMPYEGAAQILKELSEGKTILADGDKVNYQLVKSIPENVAQKDIQSPVMLMKAVKNPREMENIRNAHIKDGVAVTRFIYWLKNNAGKEKITEISAAEKLEAFRAQQEGFIGPSFQSIIGYGAHGAIIHYAATEETNVQIEEKSFCLADTGGHYLEGTTDVTRTIVMGELTDEERKMYTLVLRGHLNLGAAKFVYGVCGPNLDSIAREPLWEYGLDYNHGTGHGVGHILSVHEGPQRFHWNANPAAKSAALEEGMVISDEPGVYLAGKFGIRHENLVLCRKGEKNEYGQFMYFEELTMVPFDTEAIDVSLITEKELAHLNAYHQKVYYAISPYLEGEELEWLKKVTRPLTK
ncbi:MAG: aminopeptidase P family protein [Eubacteriales bacterium]|nr:aminopeptidase P family protein [Eubacteriales bacterium]